MINCDLGTKLNYSVPLYPTYFSFFVGSEDDTIKTWDIIEGHMIKSYDGLGIDPDNVLFIMNDKLIMAHYQQRIKGIRQAGDVVYTIEVSGTGAAYGVGGKNKSVIAVFENQMAKLYDGETGNHLTTVEHPDTYVQFQDEGCVAGKKINNVPQIK